jgi:hypothetical protein
VEISVKARIDRIDETGGYRRIIDYKTGTCELDFKDVDGLFSSGNPNRRKEVFQVLFYADLYERLSGFSGDLYPELWRFIRFRAGDDARHIMSGNQVIAYSDVREEFRANLDNLLAEIFDPEVMFSPTENEMICKNCRYAGLCGRD